jgi:uncharacterized protein YndB with AHSA1/START domain
MKQMRLRFQVQSKIQKPVDLVFDAVYNPKKLSEYFTTGGSNGPLDEGKTVTWAFDYGHGAPSRVEVQVEKMIPGKLIRFKWPASEGTYDPVTGTMPHPGGYETTVEMTFEPLSKNETLVKIVEGEWRSTGDGLQGSYQNCEGWMNMSCCLKAYLEYGIQLVKGFY